MVFQEGRHHSSSQEVPRVSDRIHQAVSLYFVWDGLALQRVSPASQEASYGPPLAVEELVDRIKQPLWLVADIAFMYFPGRNVGHVAGVQVSHYSCECL